MTTRSTIRKAISPFVFSFMYFLLSCGSSGSVSKNNAKAERVKIHLVIADGYDKTLFDTIYERKLASFDTFRINKIVAFSDPPDRTGGSSRCSVTMDVYKVSDDDDDDDDKN